MKKNKDKNIITLDRLIYTDTEFAYNNTHQVTLQPSSTRLPHHYHLSSSLWFQQNDGLVHERRNSSALAMELRLSCINPSKSCI